MMSRIITYLLSRMWCIRVSGRRIAFRAGYRGYNHSRQKLQGVVADAVPHVGGGKIAMAHQAFCPGCPIEFGGRLAHQQAGGGEPAVASARAKLHALEFADRTSKLLALLRVTGQGIVESLLAVPSEQLTC